MLSNLLYGSLQLLHNLLLEDKTVSLTITWRFFREQNTFTRKRANRLNPELLLTFDCFWITVAMKLTTSQTVTQDVACFAFCLFQTHFQLLYLPFPSLLNSGISKAHTIKSPFGFLFCVVCHCGAS